MPLVLLYKVSRQHGSPQASCVESGQLGNQRLAECGNSNSMFNRPRHIKDAELNSIEKWMRADIPPDFFAIVDTTCFDESLHIGIKISPRGEDFGYPAARKGFPHY